MTPAVKRYAVITFLLAWLALPAYVLVLEELPAPWFQVACWAIAVFIVIWVWLMVRAIRRG
ncbi:hypothetical protein ASD37_13995 [Mycobacterium sp. Root135]|uniref:hypothetical protein n=1 Tax=Mycobacterium sp. Root135 TaxID=1736457 RepID=UPI0006F57359|nr:hypothetical protein [Mycobacterium sp. Root135]KQY07181.1 hypothetical protein ASD37_13995 [Mycobacterium sp. Root135]